MTLSRRATARRSGLAVAVVSIVALGPASAADAQAEIAVEMSVTAPTYALGDASYLIVVTNPGTVALSDVIVTAEPPDAFPSTLTGPVIDVGNEDIVLDPGEQWSYRATGVHAHGEAGATATARGPDSGQVSASDRVAYDVLDPVELLLTPDRYEVVSGNPVTWRIEITNVSIDPLVVSHQRARLLPEPFLGTVPYDPVGPPIDRGDGDDVLQTDETWVWSYATSIAQTSPAQVRLDMSLVVDRREAPVIGFRYSAWSDLVTVVAAEDLTSTSVVGSPSTSVGGGGAGTMTTNATVSELPPTGGADLTRLLALGPILAGALLVAITRRGGRARSAT